MVFYCRSDHIQLHLINTWDPLTHHAVYTPVMRCQMVLVLGKQSRLGEPKIFLQRLVQGTLNVTDIQRQLWRNVFFFIFHPFFKQILKPAFYSRQIV